MGLDGETLASNVFVRLWVGERNEETLVQTAVCGALRLCVVLGGGGRIWQGERAPTTGTCSPRRTAERRSVAVQCPNWPVHSGISCGGCTDATNASDL